MTKYQFEIPNEEWARWRETVPRSKNLDERIRELLEADAEGRVLEARRESGEAAREPVESPLPVPGEGEAAEQRREAVSAVRAYVREHGRAPKDELVQVGAEIAGDTYADEYSLWKNLLQPQLAELEEIESEGQSGFWRVVE